LLVLGIVAFVGAGIGLTIFLMVWSSLHKKRDDLILYTVTRETLPLTIAESGQLESKNNNDIVCRMKARAQGSNVASTIKWVIDDGSHVQADRKGGILSVLIWDPQEFRFVDKEGTKGGTVRVVQVYAEETSKPEGTVTRLLKLEKTKPDDKPVYADLLVELDDSGLQDQYKTEKIKLDQAESDMIQAEQAYKIQVSQNLSDIETARTKLTLAELELKKYTGWTEAQVRAALAGEPDDPVIRWPFTHIETRLPVLPSSKPDDSVDKSAEELAKGDLTIYTRGDYVANLKDLMGKVVMARSDYDQQVDRAAWARRMVKKGFQTPSQAQAEESKEESYKLALRKATLDLDVLVKYTRRKEETSRKRDVEEYRLALERVLRQTAANEVKFRKDRDAKTSVYKQELARCKDIEDEIKKSVLYAPKDGLVVYWQDDRTRWGVGRQSLMAQGEQVVEGQKLMQIPDLAHMLANTKVHEALISRVKEGQPAEIKCTSFSNEKLRGRVSSVATVAAAADFFAADVKVYVTKVQILGKHKGLKPGMTAEVTITTGDPLERVLTVPVEAIVGGAELGANREVYVINGKAPELRPVKIGESNDKKVQIREGLEEGDQVVLNPKVLLGDNAKKIRQPGEDKGQGEGKGKGDYGKQPGGPGDRSGAPKQSGGPQDKGGARGGPAARGGAGGAQGGQGGGEGGFQMTEEQKKQAQEFDAKMKKATPQERKKLLEQVPEAWRDAARQRYKAQGIEIAD
jgi:multidrug resistance efflux pump